MEIYSTIRDARRGTCSMSLTSSLASVCVCVCVNQIGGRRSNEQQWRIHAISCSVCCLLLECLYFLRHENVLCIILNLQMNPSLYDLSMMHRFHVGYWHSSPYRHAVMDEAEKLTNGYFIAPLAQEHGALCTEHVSDITVQKLSVRGVSVWD